MRWVGLYRKHKVLVPSSLAPVLLPVVGGAANKPVSLAAEKLLVKSKIIRFMCFVHQFNYVFKAFAPPTPSFPSPPEEPSWPIWSPLWWQLRWDGVQQLLPVTRLLCCYFCALWLWQGASSVLFTTALAPWLSCNLWTCVSSGLLKIIPIGGACSGSSWSRQQGLWGLVLGAESGCCCLRSALLWAGNFNFPSKYWYFPPTSKSSETSRRSAVWRQGRGEAGSEGLFVYRYQSHWKWLQAPCRIPVKLCPKGETQGRSKLVFCWPGHSMFLGSLTSPLYPGSLHSSSFELSVKWNPSLMSDIFIICRGNS